MIDVKLREGSFSALLARFIVAKHRTAAGLCRNNPHISSACRVVVGGFERWFNLTVVNISEDDADDYTCVGVNAGKVNFGDVCNFCNFGKTDTIKNDLREYFTVMLALINCH